jgi:hypothetical protein
MEKDWVRIYEAANEVKAEMARQLLEDHYIDSIIMNKKDRAYGFGEFEVYVLRDFVIIAKEQLKNL